MARKARLFFLLLDAGFLVLGACIAAGWFQPVPDWAVTFCTFGTGYLLATFLRDLSDFLSDLSSEPRP